tara:strand:- start:120 stop:1097 length:978 start_codon:yes stop_codon:yes gene_type:complete
MAFLDNSGDIILDAVLTDAGRKRLARGDGTFKVTKFAFGDDEIDYGSYNPDHASGSAYYDLEVLQTPVLEAFTNNRSSLKSRLISLTNNNLLFLPVLVLNENSENKDTQRTEDGGGNPLSSGSFLVSVNANTNTDLSDITLISDKGYINGNQILKKGQSRYIRVDQGLDTTMLSAIKSLSTELTERQYMIQIDNRLGTINDMKTAGSPAFIDDDQIATYYVTMGVGDYVSELPPGELNGGTTPMGGSSGNYQVIPGPRGTSLQFGIGASDNLKSSTYLFETIGETGISAPGTAATFSTIDTTVKVTGVTTGYTLDIPITFVRTST